MSRPRLEPPWDIYAFAVFAGVVSWFSTGGDPFGEGMAWGLAATAFWLVVGTTLSTRQREAGRRTGKSEGEPDPWDRLA